MQNYGLCTPAASIMSSTVAENCLPWLCCLAVLRLDCLLHLQEQQQAISAGLSSFAQPQLQAEHGEHTAAGEDEYDPEDADMQLEF